MPAKVGVGFHRRRFTRRPRHVKRRFHRKSHHRRHSKFPVPHLYTKFLRSEIKHPEDQIFTRMNAIYYINLASSTVAAVDPNTGMSGWLALPMNNISTLSAQITTNTATTASMATSDPQGLNEMMTNYSTYQVRGTRFDIDFMAEEITGTTSTRLIDVVAFPLDSALYTVFAAAVIATNPFERYAQQPKASKRGQILKAADYLSSGTDGKCHISIFDSPAKIDSSPLYYGGTGSTGTYTAAPTDTPRFIITWAQEGSAGAAASLQYRVRIRATYAVVFFGRNLVPYNAPKPAVRIPPKPDLSEAEFDTIPECKVEPVVPPSPQIKPQPAPPTRPPPPSPAGWFS